MSTIVATVLGVILLCGCAWLSRQVWALRKVQATALDEMSSEPAEDEEMEGETEDVN